MSRSADHRRPQRGFSLIEAVVTTALVSFGLLGLQASSVLLTRLAKEADSTSAATGLGSKQLEILRSMPLDAVGHIPGSYDGGNYYPNGNSGGPINVSWTVSANDTPRAGLKTVTVTSTWTDGLGTRSASLGGYVRCSTVPCRVYW
jgi:Tfp pilus assembly protein PilV